MNLDKRWASVFLPDGEFGRFRDSILVVNCLWTFDKEVQNVNDFSLFEVVWSVDVLDLLECLTGQQQLVLHVGKSSNKCVVLNSFTRLSIRV